MLSMLIPPVFAGVIGDAPPLQSYFINVLNFLLSVFGVLAIIGLVMAGGLFLISAGDPARVRLAKRAALAATLGVVFAIGALVVVRQLENFYQ